MENSDRLIPALQEVSRELLKRDRLQCIDIAASILEQLMMLKSLMSPEDVVEVKSIPTPLSNEFEHVWVEINGIPIDPDREEQTPAGEEVRECIRQAEQDGTIQINNHGLLRVMGINLARLKNN